MSSRPRFSQVAPPSSAIVRGAWRLGQLPAAGSRLSAHERLAAIASGCLRGLSLTGDAAGLLRSAFDAAAARGTDEAPAEIELEGARIHEDAIALLDKSGLSALRASLWALPSKDLARLWDEVAGHRPNRAPALLPATWRLAAPLVPRRATASLCAAIAMADAAWVGALLAAGVNPNRVSQPSGGSCAPLHEAVRHLGRPGSLGVLALLLRAGADPALRAPKTGFSPLQAAATQRGPLAIEAVRALLAAGADPAGRGLDGSTALHGAAEVGADDAVIALLVERGGGIDARDRSGAAPLHRAADRAADRAILALLGHGAAADSVDAEGGTPLHRRCRLPVWNPDAVRALAARMPDIDLPDLRGDTALMRAAVWGNAPAVRLLTAAGADPARAVGPHGLTALMRVARDREDPSVIEALLDGGADLEARDRQGWTAAMHAAAVGRRRALAVLLDRGADPDATAADGRSLEAIADVAMAPHPFLQGRIRALLADARVRRPSSA